MQWQCQFNIDSTTNPYTNDTASEPVLLDIGAGTSWLAATLSRSSTPSVLTITFNPGVRAYAFTFGG